MQDAQIKDEFERVVSLVEEMTGLKSRWRGGSSHHPAARPNLRAPAVHGPEGLGLRP